MIRRPPRSTRTDTLFPYTTLFRSSRAVQERVQLVDEAPGAKHVQRDRAGGGVPVHPRCHDRRLWPVGPADVEHRLAVAGSLQREAVAPLTNHRVDTRKHVERMEERPVEKECDRPGKYRWWQYESNRKNENERV